MIKRSQEGKIEFTEIYNDFNGKIRRYLSRLVGEADSEDVTQEVFLKINAALGTFRGESSLSTWIYRIATNTAMDHLRKSNLLKQVGDNNSTTDSVHEEKMTIDFSSPAFDTELIRKEMNECIRGIVEGLPENYRLALVLSDLEEMTNQEIAEVLDISLEAVKIRLHRARARLKKELEHHCSFYRDDRNELACDRKTSPLKFLKK